MRRKHEQNGLDFHFNYKTAVVTELEMYSWILNFLAEHFTPYHITHISFTLLIALYRPKQRLYKVLTMTPWLPPWHSAWGEWTCRRQPFRLERTFLWKDRKPVPLHCQSPMQVLGAQVLLCWQFSIMIWSPIFYKLLIVEGNNKEDKFYYEYRLQYKYLRSSTTDNWPARKIGPIMEQYLEIFVMLLVLVLKLTLANIFV